MVWGSGRPSPLIARHFWIVWLGAGILGDVAGEMIIDHPLVWRWLGAAEGASGMAASRSGGGRAGGQMEIEPVKSTRIYEEIVRQVKRLIAEGKLKSGDRLPPERDLVEEFMVSRTAVREALRALEGSGLIDVRAGEGAFVRDVSVESLIESLALVILPHREAVKELFEARRLLEPAIAGLAAGRATREEIAEMERILEEQHQEVLQGRTGVVQDTALHAAIAHSAHNRAITRIVSALMDLLTQSREESLHTPGRPTRSHADHRRILKAIQRRDAVAAHRSMLDHLIAVETLVTSAQGLDRRDAPAHRKKRSTKS